MALMAESYGLGILYSGLFSIAANKAKTLRKFLGLQSEHIWDLIYELVKEVNIGVKHLAKENLGEEI